MNPPRRRMFLGLLATLAGAAAVGCGGPGFEEEVAGFATPTRALESGNATLVRLVEEVRQERGFATQLDRGVYGPERENAAVALAGCYSDSLHLRLTPIAEALLHPDAEPGDRAEFLDKHKALLEKTAAAIDLPQCRFKVRHGYGFFAKMGYLDDATLGVHLLSLRALGYGEGGRSAEALADLLRALRLAHWVGDVRRVESRVLSALLRGEALGVAETLINSGVFRGYDCEQLYGALRNQLVDWPEDRRMFVGERATVLHAYEAIRAGMLSRLVTLDERQHLQGDGSMAMMESATPAVIDEDEALYLVTLKELLGAIDRPHPERKQQIEETFTRVSARPSLFARALFLNDLPDALGGVAEDRARAEAWTIALAAAGGFHAPPFRDSALTGEPYEVQREAGRVAVTYAEDLVVSLPMLTL